MDASQDLQAFRVSELGVSSEVGLSAKTTHRLSAKMLVCKIAQSRSTNCPLMGKQFQDTPKTVEVRVADRLSALRLDQGLTLNGLARQCGLSESYLSRIENHKSAINIANLNSIAIALGVPIAAFFEDNLTERPIAVCRSGSGKKVRLSGSAGLVAHMLAADKKAKLMEPFVVDLMSAKEPFKERSHQGDEFLFILEGECILHYGKDEIRMRKGDSAYYDPRIPHFTQPVEQKGCTVLAVVASRNYLFHGDITRLLKDES